MAPKPRLRVDPGPSDGRPPSSFVPASADDPVYPHTSTFRSLQMEIVVKSPSVKMTRLSAQQEPRSLPVFGESDRIMGKVVLAKGCAQSGRLTVTVEGTFCYNSPNVEPSPQREQKHVFFSSSSIIPLSSSQDGPRSALTIRDAFVATVRRVERRPSLPALSEEGSETRSIPFTFELPNSSRVGEELPPTFSSSVVMEGGIRNRAHAENAEVAYRIIVLWEALDASEDRSLLDFPILVHPDTDFSSLDGLSYEPESWLEMPLKTDRPIRFQCAVTLPSPAVFPRSAAIPYFVVFTTTPRSSTLAREIAADATITVSLIREVQITTSQSGLPTPPPSPPSYQEDTIDSPSTATSTSSRLLKRVVKGAPPLLSTIRTSFSTEIDVTTPTRSSNTQSRSRTPSISYMNLESKDKPLPRIPFKSPETIANGFLESRILQTDVCVGFPKRPRMGQNGERGHPSLELHKILPDGLYKGKMQLRKTMLPGIEWAGLSVKYFLEVSVLFGQDDLKARVPIRIF